MGVCSFAFIGMCHFFGLVIVYKCVVYTYLSECRLPSFGFYFLHALRILRTYIYVLGNMKRFVIFNELKCA